MLAAVAVAQNPEDPISCLHIKQMPEPEAPMGWTKVKVKTSSLNLHDVWTLRGVGHPAERLPMILGCEAAGVTEDGREVIVYPVIANADAGLGDETHDPNRTVLSELYHGGFAEYLIVPERNLIEKPAWLSFEEAACIGAAWCTAYRMLFVKGGVKAGDTVLVQGAGGGVNSAAIRLAVAAGAVVYATSRTAEKREFAKELGARAAFEPGAKLPERVDVVVETVGQATWRHSLRCLRPGGTIVIAGATSGYAPDAELQRIFYQELRIIGSTMCTRTEMVSMLRMMEATGLRPTVDRVVGLPDIKAAFADMVVGNVRGKIVVDCERQIEPGNV